MQIREMNEVIDIFLKEPNRYWYIYVYHFIFSKVEGSIESENYYLANSWDTDGDRSFWDIDE